MNASSTPLVGCYITIYGLFDKDDNIFYVGQTSGTLRKRLSAHISTGRLMLNNNRTSKKISDLNGEVYIKEIDRVWVNGKNKSEAIRKGRSIETRWINNVMSEGYTLTNVSQVAANMLPESIETTYYKWSILEQSLEYKTNLSTKRPLSTQRITSTKI